MDQVSPDLLLMIFKELSSKEMVSVMRVERKWLKIIDEHKSLWRELVLPSKESFNRWGLQALELFDRKSNSTLKRVSMDVAEGVISGPFVEILEKSKDTLRVLELERKNYWVKSALEESLWKFPKLVDCKLVGLSLTRDYKLRLQLGERDEGQEDDKGPNLRVLWISNSKKLLKSRSYLLDNLVSLVLLDGGHDSAETRRMLERPSRTLKHLEIHVKQKEEQPQLPPLSFPNLKFLDITLYLSFAPVFPSWMKLPSLSTLIIYNDCTLSSLPACSKLWLMYTWDYKDLSELETQCPELLELRINILDIEMHEMSAWERFDTLLSMLSERKANVEDGMEVEGVKMVNLKILAIPFKFSGLKEGARSKKAGLSKLREFVEEVVDLPEARLEIIEMEV